MNLAAIFINPETKLLRSGWRLLVFMVLTFPLWPLGGSGEAQSSTFEIGWGLIATYVILIIWVGAPSWLCLKFLDRLSFGALGLTWQRGWQREVLLGCVMSVVMMTVVVTLQALGGGTRLTLNPMLTMNQGGIVTVANSTIVALVLFILAGAFEELLFRGYPFQTLLRGAPTIVPLLLLSILFGAGHWSNPNRTIFSTANTVLAGIWLAVAYLKTRRLWFPIGLHFMWNWMMSVFYGLPVSGLRMTASPVFISTSEAPVWLTGGNYGSEGGAAATVVLVIAIIVVWRAGWLSVVPEMQSLLEPRTTVSEPMIGLGLTSESEKQEADDLASTTNHQPPTPT